MRVGRWMACNGMDGRCLPATAVHPCFLGLRTIPNGRKTPWFFRPAYNLLKSITTKGLFWYPQNMAVYLGLCRNCGEKLHRQMTPVHRQMTPVHRQMTRDSPTCSSLPVASCVFEHAQNSRFGAVRRPRTPSDTRRRALSPDALGAMRRCSSSSRRCGA